MTPPPGARRVVQFSDNTYRVQRLTPAWGAGMLRVESTWTPEGMPFATLAEAVRYVEGAEAKPVAIRWPDYGEAVLAGGER